MNTKSTLETQPLILMSYLNPKLEVKPALLNLDFTDFEAELLTRLDAINPQLVDFIEVYPTTGQYGGVAELSAMISINPYTRPKHILQIKTAAEELGKDLGQESILLRYENHNILTHCTTKAVLAKGEKFNLLKKDASDDFTIFFDTKFNLELNFI